MIESIPLILTGLGLTASIVYYANILSNANKTRELQLKAQLQAEETRQTQLFMNVYNRFQDPDFTKMWINLMQREWKDVDDYWKKYDAMDSDVLSVQTFFEGIGVLLKNKLIDPDFVYELMPTMVTSLWKKYESIVLSVREFSGYPQYWRPLEYLSDCMVEIAIKKGDPVVTEYDPQNE